MAGVDYDGAALYQIDPSGVFHQWRAAAIGRNSENAKIFLEKRYKEDLGRDDAIHIALLALKDGFEGVMNSKNVEVGFISEASPQFRVLSQQEVGDALGFISD